MTNTLLPCPFCGRSAHIEQIGDRSKSTIYQCDNCSCSLETGEEWGHGRIWNERAAIPSPQTNVRVDVDRLAASIVTAACELDGPADPAGDDTISITMKDLEAVVHRHVTAALESRP